MQISDKSKEQLIAELEVERMHISDLKGRLQKRTETKVKASFYSGVIDFLISPIYIKDVNGKYLDCNKLFEEFLQLPRTAIIGKTSYGLLPTERAKMHEEMDNRLFKEGGVLSYECEFHRANGDVRIVLFRKALFIDHFGAPCGIIGEILDITERQISEKKLKELNCDLEVSICQANNLAAEAQVANNTKNEFLANMSHEIRTPLNGILGMLELLEDTDVNQEQLEYVKMAILSTKRLTRLTSDILDISRIESGVMRILSEPFNLSDSLQQVLDLFLPSSRKQGILLESHIDSSLSKNIIGDSLRLQQVLTNLIGNSFKFTKNGKITIEAYPLSELQPNQQRVLFSVADTGCGIPDERIKELFKPFSQIERGYTRNHQGAGLGLSICKQLVSLMGGNIAAESEPGVGTTFYFCITFKTSFCSLKNRSNAPSLGKSNRQRPILLAEDDKITSLATKKTLEMCGYQVLTAQNGVEALGILEDLDVELILMDIQMPKMDGLEAVKQIRNSNSLSEGKKNIPIIALTGYAMVGDREKFLEAGMNDYIPKPTDRKSLLEAINRVLST